MRRINKNVAAFLSMAVIMTGTTGCATNQIPTMTQDQTKIIEEYVVATIMKYEANHRSRLVELGEMDFTQPVPPTATEAPTGPESSGEQNQDDNKEDVNHSEQTEKNYTMEEALGVPEGVSIMFLGQKFCGQYPEESELSGFVLPASAGKKLLVLEFLVANTTEQDQAIDLLSTDAIYGVTVNDDYTHRALRAMLLDELSSFKETLPAGGSAKAVLVVEMDETISESITSLRLDIKVNSKVYPIRLEVDNV